MTTKLDRVKNYVKANKEVIIAIVAVTVVSVVIKQTAPKQYIVTDEMMKKMFATGGELFYSSDTKYGKLYVNLSPNNK